MNSAVSLAHTVYGGAHLFKSTTPERLGSVALRALHTYLPTDESFDEVFGPGAHGIKPALEARLLHAPVDDYRIDFEDGLGLRSEAEEHELASAAGAALRQMLLLRKADTPPLRRVGLRTRGWTHPERVHSTLERFTQALGEVDFGPTDFVATLPKVRSHVEVERFAAALAACERVLGWKEETIGMELLVEHPAAMMPGELQSWVRAGSTRLRGLHLGAYDFLAELGVPHHSAALAHPYCDGVRMQMRVACAGSTVETVDGVTNIVPVEPHRGTGLDAEQHAENTRAMREAWALHRQDVEHGLSLGFFQGWDVHPAQLVSRHATLLQHFATHLPAAEQRLRGFQNQARQARTEGLVFDDEASMRSVELFLTRAHAARGPV